MPKSEKDAETLPARSHSENLPARKGGKVIPTVGFTKVEKNLASLGFFTASSNKIRGIQEKKITLTRRESGSKTVEATATILPSGKYGLPITADQDKYLALLKIVADIRLEKGKVENPIPFTSAELLRLLNKSLDSGKNYEDIEDWLNRMTLTGINSKGVVFLAGRKRWASDTFHVFERAISLGKELPDGTVAEKNYVWLSEWQLENINSNFLFPIDLDTYTQVRNHIAKTLIPLLQIWLYASSADGSFEKRYTELCEILNIRRYQHLSKIREKLGPSLDELIQYEYLSSWRIDKTADRKDFKVVFFHGPKFWSDAERSDLLKGSNNARLERGQPDDVSAELFEALLERGISEKKSRQLAASLAKTENTQRVLEWVDREVARVEPDNPAGFFIHLIEQGVVPPDWFETSADRQRNEEEQLRLHAVEEEERMLQSRYEAFIDAEVDASLARLSKKELEARLSAIERDLTKTYPVLCTVPKRTRRESAENALKRSLREEIPLPSLAEFRKLPQSRGDVRRHSRQNKSSSTTKR